MGLWVPPTVSDELVEERQQFRRDLEQQIVSTEMLRVKGVLDQFNYELRQIDPLLEMVRAGENTYNTPLKAGYYHIVRWNEGAPPSVIAIEGSNGEFVEPTSRVFEMLKKQDLWDPANMKRLTARQAKLDEACERQKIRDREERQEEIMDRVLAATQTRISMNRDSPWSQNTSGRRGVNRAARRAAK